ncbi:MAG: TylF/MycF/NovP-related O-methyltransferase [Vitreimonas sp.]
MTAPSHANRDAYIELLKRSVTNYAYLGGDLSFDKFRCVTHYDVEQGSWKIDALARPVTLLTKNQLDLIERCVLDLEERGVPGDFIEAGVWRGGAIILMRALLDAYAIAARKIVAADSFAGIPKNVRARNDPVDLWRDRWIASLDDVRQNIARFGLLDDRIEFVVGFFADSLTTLAGRQFALMRLDSDSYDSVEESLLHLYPLLSPGGVIIVDDWHLVGCRAAVLNYRARHSVDEEIQTCEGNAYWVKR